MKSIDSFIYKPIVIFVLLILVVIGADYLLSALQVNISIVRYILYTIVIILAFMVASANARKLRDETLKIKTLETEIEQFEPVIEEIRGINKEFEEEKKKLNSSLEFLAKTGNYQGENEFLIQIANNIEKVELDFKDLVRFSINKWENISKGVNELKTSIVEKEEKLENINKFSEVLALGKYDFKLESNVYINNNFNKAINKMNSIILEKNEVLKKLEQKELEIRDLNEKLKASRTKETQIKIPVEELKIAAPKRAANVDSKDFIDFTGRGFGKY